MRILHALPVALAVALPLPVHALDVAASITGFTLTAIDLDPSDGRDAGFRFAGHRTKLEAFAGESASGLYSEWDHGGFLVTFGVAAATAHADSKADATPGTLVLRGHAEGSHGANTSARAMRFAEPTFWIAPNTAVRVEFDLALSVSTLSAADCTTEYDWRIPQPQCERARAGWSFASTGPSLVSEGESIQLHGPGALDDQRTGHVAFDIENGTPDGVDRGFDLQLFAGGQTAGVVLVPEPSNIASMAAGLVALSLVAGRAPLARGRAPGRVTPPPRPRPRSGSTSR